MVNVFSKAGRGRIYNSYPYNVAMESIWELVAVLCGTAFLAPVYESLKSGSFLAPAHVSMAKVGTAFFALVLFSTLYKVARAAQHFFREKVRKLEP